MKNKTSVRIYFGDGMLSGIYHLARVPVAGEYVVIGDGDVYEVWRVVFIEDGDPRIQLKSRAKVSPSGDNCIFIK